MSNIFGVREYLFGAGGEKIIMHTNIIDWINDPLMLSFGKGIFSECDVT